MLIASNLRKELAGTLLFDGVSFKLERRDRIALAGPNGAGKTTLLRMLTGETEVHGGELAFEKGARVALHDQRPPRYTDVPLSDYALSGSAGLAAEEDLRKLEEAMAGGDHARATLQRYADAQARLDHAGGYGWRERVSSTLRGLGFTDSDLARPLSTFSGGELTRASLARALAGDPDILLLDEPTNHLDTDSLEWLEEELSSSDAGVILVAHDRWFLEATTTAVLELEAGASTFFAGPWHTWRREKAERALYAQKTAARVAVDIARLERLPLRVPGRCVPGAPDAASRYCESALVRPSEPRRAARGSQPRPRGRRPRRSARARRRRLVVPARARPVASIAPQKRR